MKRLIFIVGFVAWFLVGCYDDKGNYDYKEINTIDGLMFMPTPIVVEEGNSYRYEYRQPAQEELKVTYSPVFTQSMVEGEDNVEYLWTVAYRRVLRMLLIVCLRKNWNWLTLRSKQLNIMSNSA